MGLTLTVMNQMRDRLATLTSTGTAVKAFVGDPPGNPGMPFVFVWGPPTLATSEATARSVRPRTAPPDTARSPCAPAQHH